MNVLLQLDRSAYLALLMLCAVGLWWLITQYRIRHRGGSAPSIAECHRDEASNLTMRETDGSVAQLQSGIEKLGEQVMRLEQKLAQQGEAAGSSTRDIVTQPVAPTSLSMREAVCRMADEQRDIPQIAAELGISRSEIELLLHLQKARN